MSNEKHWQADIMSGFVIFLIALPLSIGISLAAGAPASAGILAAILGGLVGTFFTGSHLVINGPAAGLIVVVLGSIQSLSDGDAMLGFRRTLAAIAIAGTLQIVCGGLKLGRLAFLAPSSVVHGMLSAIGVIILIKQIPVILGVKPQAKTILGMVGEIPRFIQNVDVPIAMVGLGCLIFLVSWNAFSGSFKKIIPGPLQCAILGLICSFAMGIAHAHDVEVFHRIYHLGPEFLVKVPEHFKDMIIFPLFDDVLSVRSLIAILSIFIVCSLESLLSAYAVDKLDPLKRKSDMDKELFGKGVVNLCCGLIGAYPIIAEIVRSSANVENGAKTKWSNFFHGLFILVFVAAFPKLLNYIPLASLAAVLILVGFNLAHPRHFKEVYHQGFDQFVFFMTTLIVTVVEDLLVGIAAGIVVKILFHLFRGVNIKYFFNPQIQVEELKNQVLITFNSPVVFLGYLKLQKILKKYEGQNIQIQTNEYFVDFTIRELIKDSIHDAVELAALKH